MPVPTRKTALSRMRRRRRAGRPADRAIEGCAAWSHRRRGPPGPRRRGGTPGGGVRRPPPTRCGRRSGAARRRAPSEGPRSGRSGRMLLLDGGRTVRGACAGSASTSGPASSARIARGRRVLSACRCLGLALALRQLLHEVVEQVAHPGRVYPRPAVLRARSTGAPSGPDTGPAQGRRRPSTARRKAASATSARAFGVMVAARAGSQRMAAWTTSGADQGGRARRAAPAGAGGSAGGPSSSRTKPASPPEKSGPSRSERRIRRRSGGRGGSPAGHDPVRVGDPEDREPPALDLGRPVHAGPEASVAEHDLVLAKVRRAGWWEAGHAGQDTGRARPYGRRFSGGAAWVGLRSRVLPRCVASGLLEGRPGRAPVPGL